jgi:hypothetical protein
VQVQAGRGRERRCPRRPTRTGQVARADMRGRAAATWRPATRTAEREREVVWCGLRRPEGIRRSQRERSVGTGRVTVRPCRVARAPPRPRPDKPGGGDRDAVVIRFGAGGADAAAREGGPRVPCRLPPWRRPWGLLSSSSTRAAGGLGICLARGLERPEFGRWPAGGENALHRLGQRSAVHSSTGRLCSSGNAASRTGRMEGGWMHRATAVSVSPCVCV